MDTFKELMGTKSNRFFRLELGGHQVLMLQKFDVPELDTGSIEIRTGSSKNHTSSKPGMTKYGECTFTRYVTDNAGDPSFTSALTGIGAFPGGVTKGILNGNQMLSKMENVGNYFDMRLDILTGEDDNQPFKTYVFHDCRFVKLASQSYDATQEEALMETLTVKPDYWEVI